MLLNLSEVLGFALFVDKATSMKATNRHEGMLIRSSLGRCELLKCVQPLSRYILTVPPTYSVLKGMLRPGMLHNMPGQRDQQFQTTLDRLPTRWCWSRCCCMVSLFPGTRSGYVLRTVYVINAGG